MSDFDCEERPEMVESTAETMRRGVVRLAFSKVKGKSRQIRKAM